MAIPAITFALGDWGQNRGEIVGRGVQVWPGQWVIHVRMDMLEVIISPET